MRFTLQRMVDLLLEKYPNVAFAFGKETMRQDDWGMSFSGEESANTFVAFKPEVLRSEINGKEDFVINRNDRIAQMNIKKVEKAQFKEMKELGSSERKGGFGSTGK